METLSGALASGGRFHVDDHTLTIVGPEGDVLATISLSDISRVQRAGQVVTLGRIAASEVTVTAASLLDAEQLEVVIRNLTGISTPQPTGTEPVETQQGRSGKRILLFGGLGCIGLVVLGCLGFFALALLADDEDNDSDPVISREEPDVDEPDVDEPDVDEPDVSEDEPASIGDSIELPSDGWIITVTDVRKTDSTDFLFGEERALGVYLIVDLTLENTAKEAHKLTGRRFTIVDDQDRVYEWYSDGTIGYGQQELGSNINAGLTAPATILFDVPPDATGLVLQSLGGFKVSLGDVGNIPTD